MIIAIDGPSGAGKSTLGKMLAKKLNLLYLDTGAMYRAVGVAVSLTKIEGVETNRIVEIAENAKIELVGEPDNLKVLLNDADVSEEIRSNEASNMASIVSGIPEVRRNLVERQRNLGEAAENGAVLDGRDIGTVVFPNADVKFFLTALPEARARRRYEEDQAKGRGASYEVTLSQINERDERDKNREDSPLKVADDALIIDTSEMSEHEVFERMLAEIAIVKEMKNV